MAEEQKNTPSGGKSYTMGNVGPGARVQQGENLSWTETVFSGAPDSDVLVQQFNTLLEQIHNHPDLDEDTRVLAEEKTKAVAEGLAQAQQEPTKLRRALVDAKGWLSNTVGWAWDGLNKILTSDAAQKTIATISEASIKAAIQSAIGGRI